MNFARPAALAAILLAAACTMDDTDGSSSANPGDPVVVAPGETTIPAPEAQPKPGAPVVVPPGAEPGAAKEDTCGANAFQQYVGQKSPQITVPAGTAVRHFRTGDPLTRDLRLDRMNFEFDRAGKLVAVTCG
ncbi:hypothetical protein DRW48_14410 [Paracoccus suum]|uniref:Peptidase inhibitor I78 n=1 Tax=Paracoccus suum TaxID=2259340 RepID=A0A344PMV9_9RHOB|nr:I78 family peptidase inhibitor [Paracoccus suum]AXC50714.1 hypothetical protein DRW48_14410 [Paracoccus suum]